MIRFCFIIGLLAGYISAAAQSSQDFIKNSREFSLQGDVENAILVLKKGLEQYPNDTQIRQELAMAYYNARRNPQALETLKPLLAAEKPEETVYLIAALIYRSELQNKEAEKLYKAALKHYPNSGALYNDYGQLLESEDPGKGLGIKMWEKGIQVAPVFAGNYYQAARYYAAMNMTIWALLYGEIYVNLDSYSSRTVEIKNMLFQFYKKAFAYGIGGWNEKNPFEQLFGKTLLAQQRVAATGLNPETLSAIRTRFILDWFNHPESAAYPYPLFERHRQMLREGMFDAYNQWLFGGAANMTQFQQWTQTNSEAYQAFTRFQRQKLFVLTGAKQYK
jgi:tetratricopeptide (TPR) repeat protein